ncbi:hypothetical protein ACWIUH_00065 [Ursidibacter arcticus]
MPIIEEGRLIFNFPTDNVIKYDETDFYNEFRKERNGIKAIDFIYITQIINWLIEVKDYRKVKKTIKGELREFEPIEVLPSELSDAVSQKVFDTLEGINIAQNESLSDIYSFSQDFSQREKIKVVLHLEQDIIYERFRRIDPADILQSLKGSLRKIDVNPYVIDCNTLSTKLEINWSVQTK